MRIKTRDRIVLAAIELFNRDGEQNVTTNHIAAHLGISPGNLYYHFRNKEDVIRAIFGLYAEDLASHMAPPSPDEGESLRTSVRYLDGVLHIMWRYRFIYENLPDLLGRDAQLQEDYQPVQRLVFSTLQDHLRGLQAAGILLADEQQLAMLTHLFKQLAMFWIPYQLTLHPQAPLTLSRLRGLIPQLLFLFRPYIATAHQAQLDEMGRYFSRQDAA
ncbi:MAG: TetR/AcrR family transcriptional regulator [Aeromonadaceae bacterium]|nr:TetR/AcrR family transcriptional regulator [Aeromonadaceae bacterium]